MTPKDKGDTTPLDHNPPLKELVIYEMGHLRSVPLPVRMYHNGTVQIVEPATVLVAENGEKLTVTNHEYLRGAPLAEQVVYLEVT